MPPRYANEMEAARQARRSLFVVRQKLLNPTAKALESCPPHLRTAIEALSRLQEQMRQGEPRMRRDLSLELTALRKELRQVKSLMNCACAFHTALGNLLSPQSDDSIRYSASGAVRASSSSTLQLEG